MNRTRFLAALAATVATFTASAHASSLGDDVLGSLYTMRGVYRAGYAPAAWKKQYAGYDLEASFSEAVSALQSPTLSQLDSRRVLNNFIYAMRDYHTSISYVSTESASLPFAVQGASDRFFLSYIDRTKLPESSFPFRAGDELISFGEKSALAAVQEMQALFTENVPATDRARAVMALTARSGTRGYAIPKGPITLGIRRQGEEKVSHVQLIWEYTPEKIAPRGELQGFAAPLASTEPPAGTLFRPMMNVRTEGENLANPFALGARKTFTPDLGPKIWESDDANTFHAYIYKTPDRRLIGYLRLPSYTPTDYVKAVSDFAAILERFENVTDGLVIDQVNNPGGSVYYLYALASMIGDQPLQTPLHRMAITQSDISEALDTIKTLEGITNDEEARKALPLTDTNGYPASYQMVQFQLNQARFLISEWEAGRKLSRPYWIAGVDQINPGAVRYTKPVLVLVNHLDFSGGDFFPTILQDNKRVTVMGSRTAGAGGYVLDVKVPNNVGITSFRYTGSIAERVDGNPIENLGVTPDIPYEISVEDLTQNYTPYVKAIQGAIDGLTK